MTGRSCPAVVSAKFPRLLTSIGRRGFASKALDYSPAVGHGKLVTHDFARITVLFHRILMVQGDPLVDSRGKAGMVVLPPGSLLAGGWYS